MEIMNTIRRIIIELMDEDGDHVLPKTNIRDELAIDSLDCAELIMSFEEQFGIEISDEESAKAITVQDIHDIVSRKCQVA